jgi:hypothetical protein
MTDNNADATTTTSFSLFRVHHLVRLRGLINHPALNGKLCRIKSVVDGTPGKFHLTLLDDQVRPPVPVVPPRQMAIKTDNMRHACDYCLVVEAEGEVLQSCGKCKTARYCNAECQRADWARHKDPECLVYSGVALALLHACMAGNDVEVQRWVEEGGANENKANVDGTTPLLFAASLGQLKVVRYLVEHGADKEKVDSNGRTALYTAWCCTCRSKARTRTL